jgi:hypothetical protein
VLVPILWADDLVLLANSPEGLQEQLDGLYRFCSKFRMIVNEIKTNVMIYGKPEHLTPKLPLQLFDSYVSPVLDYVVQLHIFNV